MLWKPSDWQVKTLCSWPDLIFWKYDKENIIPRISSLTQYSPWTISIEIAQCAKALSTRQPKQTFLLSLYVKMRLFLCNYCINIYSLAKYMPTSGKVILEWWSALQPQHDKEHSNICNTLNDTCCIQFRIHSRFHQLYRQLGAGGRLIAITVISPFLMCHRYLQLGDAICTTVGSHLATQTVDSALPEVGGKWHDYTLPEDTFWWNTYRWSVPHKSLYCLP